VTPKAAALRVLRNQTTRAARMGAVQTKAGLSIDLKGKKAFVAGVADDQGFGWAIAKVRRRGRWRPSPASPARGPHRHPPPLPPRAPPCRDAPPPQTTPARRPSPTPAPR